VHGDERVGLSEQEGCAGHAGLGAEVRAVAVAVLDRIEPALARFRAGDAEESAPACGVCPVCAVISAVRREHPELAERVAEQAAGALAALRAALDEGGPTPPAAEPPQPAPQPTRRVQRIHVDRPRAAR
jgi:hypothetical protein